MLAPQPQKLQSQSSTQGASWKLQRPRTSALRLPCTTTVRVRMGSCPIARTPLSLSVGEKVIGSLSRWCTQAANVRVFPEVLGFSGNAGVFPEVQSCLFVARGFSGVALGWSCLGGSCSRRDDHGSGFPGTAIPCPYVEQGSEVRVHVAALNVLASIISASVPLFDPVISLSVEDVPAV